MILYEPGAGVVRARRACETVAEAFKQRGGDIVVARAQPSLAQGDRLQDIALSTGETLKAGQFVFACGPWLPKIFPEFLRTRLRTPMGNVYYYGTPIGDNRFVAPHMPSFNFTGITGWPSLPNDARGFRVPGRRRHADRPRHEPALDRPEQLHAAAQLPHGALPTAHRRTAARDALVPLRAVSDAQLLHRHHPEWSKLDRGGGSAEGFKFGPMVGDYVAKRVMGIEGDPCIAKGFRIPKEEFEEPPRTAADSARVKARADSVAKLRRIRSGQIP